MADLSDVETAVVNAVMLALYPDGLGRPSVVGQPVRVFRGWPLVRPLELDLGSGVSNVSVFAVPGTGRNVTRWAPISHVTPGSSSLTVQVAGMSATFGGVGGAGQVAGLLVDGQPFVYRSVAGDTALLVTAVLAEAIRSVRPCWLSAATLTVPQVGKLIGRVAADGVTTTEWARQSQEIRLTAWCPDPGQRDLICSVIGSVLSTTSFLTMSDSSAGRLRYCSSTSIDDNQELRQYRRDLIYEVEYGTSINTASPAMLFGNLNLAGDSIYA